MSRYSVVLWIDSIPIFKHTWSRLTYPHSNTQYKHYAFIRCVHIWNSSLCMHIVLCLLCVFETPLEIFHLELVCIGKHVYLLSSTLYFVVWSDTWWNLRLSIQKKAENIPPHTHAHTQERKKKTRELCIKCENNKQ